MGSARKRVIFSFAIVGAAVVGVGVGGLTATRQASTREPSVAIAELPTSTPDRRPTLPPQTLTPTQAPAPSPTPIATFPTTIQVSPPPQLTTTAPTARPTPTEEPRGRAVVFFAAAGKPPAPVSMIGAPGGSQSDKVYYRLGTLRQQKTGPEGYLNLFGTMKARLLEVSVDDPRVVTLGFSAPDGDWGVTADQVRLVLQQIVFTATEEPDLDFVRIRQNGGKPAVIAGTKIEAELTRDSVR